MSEAAATTPAGNPTLTVRIACPHCAAPIDLPATLDLRRVVALPTTAESQRVSDWQKADEQRRRVALLARTVSKQARRDGRYRICHLCEGRIYFNTIITHYEKQHADQLLGKGAE